TISLERRLPTKNEAARNAAISAARAMSAQARGNGGSAQRRSSRRPARTDASAIATASIGRSAVSAYSRTTRARRASNRMSVTLHLLAKAGHESGEAGTHAAGGQAQGPTDLGRVEAGHVTEGDQRPVVGGQAPDCRDEDVVGRLPERVGVIGLQIGELDRDDAVAAAPADELASLVGRDAHEPWPELVGIAEAAELAPDDRPGRLRGVLGQLGVAADHLADPS